MANTTDQPGQEPNAGQRAASQRTYPTRVADIRRTVRSKRNQLFLLTSPEGDIQPGLTGQGVFFRDTRFLNRLELRLNGQAPTALMHDESRGDEAVFVLTNPELDLGDGATLPKERVQIARRYALGDPLRMDLRVRSLTAAEFTLTLTLAAGAHFEDMFTVRGSPPGQRGTLHAPQAQDDRLLLAYDGADGHRRTTTLTFAPAPTAMRDTTAHFHLRLRHGEETTISVQIALADEAPDQVRTPSSDRQHHASLQQLFGALATVATDNAQFDAALRRSFDDLHTLATADHGEPYIAAGVPWYVALFGRDSLISAYELLAFQPDLARSTLEVLASYQGTRTDAFQHEEPGKILHELRVGEQANLHEIPQIPYYATVDATPWFIVLLDAYLRWTGDQAFFDGMRDHLERALGWIAANLQRSATGFLDYGAADDPKLLNQGWKDSENGIVNADGTLARPPIALVEVQGLVYAAWRGAARLFRQAGDGARADGLERDAAAFRQRFDAAFWQADQQYYALCLQRDGVPARAIASNPGQALFTGIVPDERVAAVAARLLEAPLFSGWGIRTLATTEMAYNPLEYQLGSVWPHDNALIAQGLLATGQRDAFARVFTALYDAALRFEERRLPEVFDGFGRDEFALPVHYPVACSPQAWAAGALPLLLHAALGLAPDAANGTLTLRPACLPDWLGLVTLRGLRVGAATVDLRFRRGQPAEVLATTGDVRVVIPDAGT